MSALQEQTISATEFKAKCLELMEQGALRRLDRVHVTKRGKPFVTLTLTPDEPPLAADALFGCMKDRTIIPDDYDWDAPIYSEAELDEMNKRFDEKFAHLL